MTLLWLQAGNEITWTRFIRNQTVKSKITWNQVCVLARHKLWRFFFISNVYRACMLLWIRFTIFPRNLSCKSSCFWWKLVGLFFLQFPGWKWKICRDQSRLTFSSHGFAARFHARGYACAPTWACSQAKDLFSTLFFYSISFMLVIITNRWGSQKSSIRHNISLTTWPLILSRWTRLETKLPETSSLKAWKGLGYSSYYSNFSFTIKLLVMWG